MNHEIHVITNVIGCRALRDFREAHEVLSVVRVGDTIRIVHEGECIDELMVIDGDIDNQCAMCAASKLKDHHYLCHSVRCTRGESYNPFILVSIQNILEGL